MFEQVRGHLKEIVEIADTCPEPYRERCFSVLLEHVLKSLFPAVEAGRRGAAEAPTEVLAGAEGDRLSKFASDYKLSGAEIAQVFDVEPGRCEVIVRDLKAKAKSEKQVRLALLLGVRNLAAADMPLVADAQLRDLCRLHACLDSKNFARNMKKNKDLFLKKGKDWKLTQPGLTRAAEVIKELAGLAKE